MPPHAPALKEARQGALIVYAPSLREVQVRLKDQVISLCNLLHLGLSRAMQSHDGSTPPSQGQQIETMGTGQDAVVFRGEVDQEGIPCLLADYMRDGQPVKETARKRLVGSSSKPFGQMTLAEAVIEMARSLCDYKIGALRFELLK